MICDLDWKIGVFRQTVVKLYYIVNYCHKELHFKEVQLFYILFKCSSHLQHKCLEYWKTHISEYWKSGKFEETSQLFQKVQGVTRLKWIMNC